MGLDTTHNAWHGPYSSFGKFRESLARQIGINLDDYHGYGERGTKDLRTIDHDLMPLFDHSDCDGELSVEESKKIAAGIKSVLENFNHEIEPDHEYIKAKAIQFMNGCLDAVAKNEIIYFG